MRFTKECEYALQIVRALASGEVSRAEDICSRENIPGPFTYKILKKLERAGMLMSRRGRKGGYLISKSLDAVTVYDVVSAIDDNFHVNKYHKDDCQCYRQNPDQPCSIHSELARIHANLVSDLKRVYLFNSNLVSD